MFLTSWRRKPRHKKRPGNQEMEILIPNHFRCPISLELMKDPVTLSSGITYDRESIEKWLELGNFTCPVTNQVLKNFDQIPNHTLRKMIQDWCVQNRDYGVERIPTPRIPITEMEVLDVVQGLKFSSRTLDQYSCLEMIQKVKKWGMDSERNRKCIVVNGMGSVLAKVFETFASDSYERNSTVLEEILSAIIWMIPLDEEGMKSLVSPSSLRCMVWFLNSKDVSTKQNSILVLKELSSHDQYIKRLAEIEKVDQVLFKLIKNPICSTITKASLTVIFNLISSSSCSDNTKSSFVEMGTISILLEILVDSEKSISEKALGVFDVLCGCEKGKEEAYTNDLTMPVLVKKILRVSEAATEFSVSAIWKLCKNSEKGTSSSEEKAIVEALQVGCFQKLLLLLQLGCGYETKEKATELLKLLNPYRVGLECIETVDFKSLRRSF